MPVAMSSLKASRNACGIYILRKRNAQRKEKNEKGSVRQKERIKTEEAGFLRLKGGVIKNEEEEKVDG